MLFLVRYELCAAVWSAGRPGHDNGLCSRGCCSHTACDPAPATSAHHHCAKPGHGRPWSYLCVPVSGAGQCPSSLLLVVPWRHWRHLPGRAVSCLVCSHAERMFAMQGLQHHAACFAALCGTLCEQPCCLESGQAEYLAALPLSQPCKELP